MMVVMAVLMGMVVVVMVLVMAAMVMVVMVMVVRRVLPQRPQRGTRPAWGSPPGPTTTSPCPARSRSERSVLAGAVVQGACCVLASVCDYDCPAGRCRGRGQS